MIFSVACNQSTPTNTNVQTEPLKAVASIEIPQDTIFLGGKFSVPFTVQSGQTLVIPMNTRKMVFNACYKGFDILIDSLSKGAKIECEGVCYPYSEPVYASKNTNTWYWIRQYMDPPSDWRPINISPNYVKDITFKVKNTGNKTASFLLKPKDAPATGTSCL